MLCMHEGLPYQLLNRNRSERRRQDCCIRSDSLATSSSASTRSFSNALYQLSPGLSHSISELDVERLGGRLVWNQTPFMSLWLAITDKPWLPLILEYLSLLFCAKVSFVVGLLVFLDLISTQLAPRRAQYPLWRLCLRGSVSL